MAINQAIVTLNSTTATVLDAVTSTPAPVAIENRTEYSWTSTRLLIQNIDPGSSTVYLGNASVTTSAYGIQLLAGASVEIDDLRPTEQIYAISANSSATISVLAVVR